MAPSRANTNHAAAVARIEALNVSNYRALKSVSLDPLEALTALVGPNGSGKSTVFDVFAFLSECFTVGLRRAWDKRGRFKELRTRGARGPLVIEVKYRESSRLQPITYHLEIEELPDGPVVASERLNWRRVRANVPGRPYDFLKFTMGKGWVISGEYPDERAERNKERLDSPEMLAVSTLGQLARHPRVSALRRFITGWYLSYVTAGTTRTVPEAGPQERLSQTGDNLPNVIQFLQEQHAPVLKRIEAALTRRIPRLERFDTEPMQDGRLLLRLKDAPFSEPVLAKFASDGTLKMLAYLVVLHDPVAPSFVGIEEPENHLHPRLLPELAEECRHASTRSQILVTTHSPFFLDGLHPQEAWVLYRDQGGFARAQRADRIQGIPDFMKEGASLGHLWTEGQFRMGDPLTRSGEPAVSERAGGPRRAR